MTWLAIDTWIVVIGALCAVACCLPGCFLFLRKQSMMGDAISHAVLPGLAIAFLFTGSRSSLLMFLAAAATGVLTALFTQWVSTFGRVDRGAAMGVVFTTFFALGLLLIVQAADYVDLDPGCVLYGAIEVALLDVLWSGELFGVAIDVPRAAVTIGAVALVNLLLILALFKEFRLSSFDESLSTTVGINAKFMHYLLMTMVAVTTVACFEAVGSIIVIAMLIVPAATAHLLTDRLAPMLVVSCVIAALSSVLGHAAALVVPPMLGFQGTTSSGMMAVALGGLFVLVWLFAPKHGVLRQVGAASSIETPDPV